MAEASCPKCGASNILPVVQIPASGIMTKCEQCSHPFIARPPAPEAAPPRRVGAFTIQSRSASNPRNVPPPQTAAPGAKGLGRSLREERIAERLRPLRGKTYYEILRVAPNTPEVQLKRAHQYMMSREAPAANDPGFQAWKELVDEAYNALSDSKFAKKYQRLVADSELSPKARKQRKKLEVEPKVHRMTLAIAENAMGQARYLNEWARELDPERPDLLADQSFIKYRTTLADKRAEEAQRALQIIEPLAKKWGADARLKLYLVMLVATYETIKKAKRVMAKVKDEGHPMYEMAKKTLSYSTKVKARKSGQ